MPKAFEFNKYFVHRLDSGKIILITELGRFVSLSQKEFDSMKQGDISKDLFGRLEEGHVIITKKNRASAVDDYRLRYGHVCEGVSLHIVNPTMRCNQNCFYCYANAHPIAEKGFDLDEKTAERILDFIWQSPRKDIVIEFQGGEPLANFPIIEFMVNNVRKRKGKNVHWRIVSNLTMMDETIASFLKKNNVLDICTSLDGPKKVHDKNRPWSGGSSFSKVTHWINSLRNDFGFKDLGTLCTITKNSLPYPKEIVDSYLKLDLPDLTPVPLRKIGLAQKHWDKIGYPAKDYFEFWKETVNYCIEKTRDGKRISEQFSVLSLGKMNRFEPNYHTCFSKPCGAALMQASYQPNGDIFTCDEGKAEPIFKIGNVEQPYKAVFTSPEALNIISLSSSLGFACNECKFTGFCRFCPVLTYAIQGNLIPKLALDEDCKLKKEQFNFLLEKLFDKDREILEKWLGK